LLEIYLTCTATNSACRSNRDSGAVGWIIDRRKRLRGPRPGASSLSAADLATSVFRVGLSKRFRGRTMMRLWGNSSGLRAGVQSFFEGPGCLSSGVAPFLLCRLQRLGRSAWRVNIGRTRLPQQLGRDVARGHFQQSIQL
jgi:hypothetical protein